ncbi:MAG: DUF433 domain-containing protein [Phycisphaerales bacterium]|nr:DUF433 domain-containing protein [Phycisphaerales bacterium]
MGKPIIKGSRISVEHVIELMGRGYSVAEVVAQHPHISEHDVQACLAYASYVLKSERVYPLLRV